MMDGVKIVLVAAVGENGVIGRDGQLPWRLKSDLRHFRALTLDDPGVIVRRVEQPCPEFNWFLHQAVGVVTAPSLQAALDLARKDCVRRGSDEIMVIGGSGVFADTMPIADRLEITLVHATPEGDVHFPAIDPAVWEAVSREERDAGPDDEASFSVATYLRR